METSDTKHKGKNADLIRVIGKLSFDDFVEMMKQVTEIIDK